MNGVISRRSERTKTEPKTTWSKDSSDYSARFRLVIYIIVGMEVMCSVICHLHITLDVTELSVFW